MLVLALNLNYVHNVAQISMLFCHFYQLLLVTSRTYSRTYRISHSILQGFIRYFEDLLCTILLSIFWKVTAGFHKDICPSCPLCPFLFWLKNNCSSTFITKPSLDSSSTHQNLPKCQLSTLFVNFKQCFRFW